MSRTQDSFPRIHVSLINHVVPDMPPNCTYPPFNVKAMSYFNKLPSKPRLISRSSYNTWQRPTAPEDHLVSKELTPLGMHLLDEERIVDPAIDCCLQVEGG